MKWIKIGTGLFVLCLLGGVAAGIIFFDYGSWRALRRLSEELKNARSVTLEEYAGSKILAHRTASQAEIDRLRMALDKSRWPFFHRPALCFNPHHGIQIARVNDTKVRADICFECDNFVYNGGNPLPLPPQSTVALSAFFESIGMPPIKQ